MQKAIVDKLTGVAVSLTTDEAPQYDATKYDVVEVADDVTFKDGHFKVDSKGEVVIPTKKELEDAGVDEEFNKLKAKEKRDAYKAAIDVLAADGSLPANLQNFFKALKDLV